MMESRWATGASTASRSTPPCTPRPTRPTSPSRNDLEALFEKIDAAGISPVIIHGADWSLGAHYIGLTYSLQSKSVEAKSEVCGKTEKRRD